METYVEFLNRINSFEKKELVLGERFEWTSLSKKVNADNSFRSFFGDTVVFSLSDDVKSELNKLTDILYSAAPSCFCERLVPHTFHMTLHDLSNSPVLGDVAEDMFRNELKIVEIKKALSAREIAPIKMKSNYIFNMVNTSLVLGLYPATENDHRRLTELYSIFDCVKKLNYPLTPHITLAYYNINGFDAKAAKALEAAVNSLNNKLNLQFTLGALYYQKFTSMNDYVDIIDLLNTHS